MRLPVTIAYLLTAGLTITLLFTACGGGDDQSIPTPAAPKAAGQQAATPAPPQPAPPVTPDELPPPVEGLAAHFVGKVDLPDYYPKDAPAWPGLRPAEAKRTADGKATVVWGIDNDAETIVSSVKRSVEENGWSINIDEDLENGHMIRAEKGGRTLSAVVSPVQDTGKTMLAIVVSL